MPLLLKSLLSLYPLLLKAFLSSSPSQDPHSKIHSVLLPHLPGLVSHQTLVILSPWCLLSSPSSPHHAHCLHLRSGFHAPLSPSPKPLSPAAGESILKCIHCTLGSVSFWLKNLYWLPIAFRIKPKLLSKARHSPRDLAHQTSAIPLLELLLIGL